MSGVFYHSAIHGLGFFICFKIYILRAKSNRTRFFNVLYSDKTWIFDQSERALSPIYILILDNYIIATHVISTVTLIAPFHASVLEALALATANTIHGGHSY